MKFFLDSEFIDDGSTIDPISIGIVSEDGREYYAQFSDFSTWDARDNEWLKENVLPHLTACEDDEYERAEYAKKGLWFSPNEFHCGVGKCRKNTCPWRTRAQVRDEIKLFLNPSDGIELIGWCAGCDFVMFCQLFGTMMDLPQGWPHYIKDLQHILDDKGIPDEDLPPQEGTAHNALSDAKHIKRLWDLLQTPGEIYEMLIIKRLESWKETQ